MIEASGLTKNYGAKTAVDRLSFAVRPGVVTGFLGPNGSGKSTTMRLMLGLDQPDRGRAVINGREYRSLPAPLTEVGAMLEARAVHTGRSARNHLLAMAATHRIPRRRVDEVIGMVGLDSVARQAGRRVLARYGAAPGHRARRCSATRGCCCWTSPSTVWTPKASCGSATCSRDLPPRDARYSSPPT